MLVFDYYAMLSYEGAYGQSCRRYYDAISPRHAITTRYASYDDARFIAITRLLRSCEISMPPPTFLRFSYVIIFLPLYS